MQYKIIGMILFEFKKKKIIMHAVMAEITSLIKLAKMKMCVINIEKAVFNKPLRSSKN